MNLTPVEMHTDWTLAIVLLVIALAIAGLIWWHRRTPTQAQTELKAMYEQIQKLLHKDAPIAVAAPVDPLVYAGRKFPDEQALAKYKEAEATLAAYKL